MRAYSAPGGGQWIVRESQGTSEYVFHSNKGGLGIYVYGPGNVGIAGVNGTVWYAEIKDGKITNGKTAKPSSAEFKTLDGFVSGEQLNGSTPKGQQMSDISLLVDKLHGRDNWLKAMVSDLKEKASEIYVRTLRGN